MPPCCALLRASNPEAAIVAQGLQQTRTQVSVHARALFVSDGGGLTDGLFGIVLEAHDATAADVQQVADLEHE